VVYSPWPCHASLRMRTADFLPLEAYENHLERRRTPKRLAILGAFAVLCLVGGGAVALEADHQSGLAEKAEAPNQLETTAGEELRGLYKEMNQYVSRLDPLADHLRMPALGGLLAELAGAAGEFVQIEKIEWAHDVKRKGVIKIDSAEIHLAITALVRGDQNLVDLPARLVDYTGFTEAYIGGNTELILNMNDTVRATIFISGPLLLPGFDTPVMHSNGGLQR
jgi:hypothetical protein